MIDLEAIRARLQAATPGPWMRDKRGSDERATDTLQRADGDQRIWLGLEQSDDGGWGCGWLMQPDEAAEFVIEANGRTPTEAARNLRTKMIEGS